MLLIARLLIALSLTSMSIDASPQIKRLKPITYEDNDNDEDFWFGPGYYYGIWFSNENDYWQWRENHPDYPPNGKYYNHDRPVQYRPQQQDRPARPEGEGGHGGRK